MPAWKRRTHHSDPTVGRFTSQDSFLGEIDAPPSLHRYFYAHANPVRYVDPTGHCVALPGICEAAVSRFVANTRNVNFAGSASGSTAGKLLNFGLHAGIESVGTALTLPQNAVLGVGNAVTPGGFSYWGGNQVDTSYAPARAQQVAALDAAADSNRSFGERGVYGALAVLSTPVTLVESLTTAPGGRAAESLGHRIHQAETAKSIDDYAFAQLEGFGDLVGAFNSYGALAAPFAPRLATPPASLAAGGKASAALPPATGVADVPAMGARPPLTPDPYVGIRQASAYLKEQNVSRAERVRILQSFNAENMVVRQAGTSEFGLRFFSDAAKPGGSYLFETFPASRESLAIKPEWSTTSGFKQFQIRPGATVIEGGTAPQGPYLPGGQSQKFIPDWRKNLLELQ